MRITSWLRLFASRLHWPRVSGRARRRGGLRRRVGRLAFERLEDRTLLSATITNLELDNSSGASAWNADGDRLAFLVEEGQQQADLNGDGDASDFVLHVWDAATGVTTNLGLEGYFGWDWSPDGAHLALRVYEGYQGNTDLNGDGDASDLVLHVWDAATGVTTNLGLDGSTDYTWSPDGAHLAVLVDEGYQGYTDLNGDGDGGDQVLHVWDAATGVATNLGLEGYFGWDWSPDGA